MQANTLGALMGFVSCQVSPAMVLELWQILSFPERACYNISQGPHQVTIRLWEYGDFLSLRTFQAAAAAGDRIPLCEPGFQSQATPISSATQYPPSKRSAKLGQERKNKFWGE